MYQQHFAFKHYPFEHALAVDELFVSEGQQEAGARLSHLMQMRGGIGVLSGEPGCGKSTVCRKLLSELHPGLYRPRYVSLTTGSVLDLYNVIADAFGLAATRQRSQAFLTLRADVSKQISESRQVSVLVVDEAHFLRGELLNELRLLTNYRMDSEYRLCLLLSGHTELRSRLSMSAYESIRQRITAHYHLGGLEPSEVADYLEHRLRLAGAEVPIFESGATATIAQASGGVPRRIDRLAHLALSAAAIAKRQMVSLDDVQVAIDEVML